MPKVILTGGGTAGHVTPNLALIPYLKEAGFEIKYIGSYDGIEQELVKKQGLDYIGIASGKLRRYISGKNLTDLGNIQKGYHEARKIIKEEKPDVVFSKGGFVTVPVVAAAGKEKIPVVIHESDLTPGLANRLSVQYAKVICYNFEETGEYLSKGKQKAETVHTGLPIRDELLSGTREKGLEFLGFSGKKPVLMVIGGSLGSVNVNNAVRESLPELLERFDVAHICGKDKTDESVSAEGYRQFEYVHDELKDIMAAADAVISRAGANVIWEIAALAKPALLIPLGTAGSRGDQILNAASFKEHGYSAVLSEDELGKESLLREISRLWENKAGYIEAMKNTGADQAARKVAEIIIKAAER